VIKVEFERVEALELLGMTLAHLNDAEAKAEVSPRLPLLTAIRDKLAFALREE
jgi:aerobic-type carbon monoxide dehydrogenase small subunit (CoxS/CutS family)